MHAIKKSRRIKKSLTVVAILLIAGLLAGLYFYVLHGSLLGWSPVGKKSDSSDINYSKPTAEQIENGEEIKANSVSDKSEKPGLSGSDQPTSPTPNTEGMSSVEVSITAVSQTSSLLQVRSLISAIDTAGTCTLVLKMSGHTPVTMSAGTQNLSNTSTCRGFDVPLSSLSPGNWQLNLTYTSPRLTGSVSKTVTVN
jgi:hypothetical protein